MPTNWKALLLTNWKARRFYEAYLAMAKIGYRPNAPSDGCGNIKLTAEELDDSALLADEAGAYAATRFEQDEEMEFAIYGCTDGTTNRAFLYLIEAAELLCGGDDGNRLALRLIDLAREEINREGKPCARRCRRDASDEQRSPARRGPPQ